MLEIIMQLLILRGASEGFSTPFFGFFFFAAQPAFGAWRRGPVAAVLACGRQGALARRPSPRFGGVGCQPPLRKAGSRAGVLGAIGVRLSR